ncbi:hypothetical protein [Thermodesulfovibrio sp. TK110]
MEVVTVCFLDIKMVDIKEIIALSVYKTDYIYPQLKDTVKCVLYDIIFSKTVLEGKASARISYSDFAFLSGCSLTTIKTALKEMLADGYIKIVGAYYSRIANEYALNIKIPENLTPISNVQRVPQKVVKSTLHRNDVSKKYELTQEGHAIVNAIKSSMSQHERKLYEKKAIDELIIENTEITEQAIENKITEIIVRNFSNEKRKKYVVSSE